MVLLRPAAILNLCGRSRTIRPDTHESCCHSTKHMRLSHMCLQHMDRVCVSEEEDDIVFYLCVLMANFTCVCARLVWPL